MILSDKIVQILLTVSFFEMYFKLKQSMIFLAGMLVFTTLLNAQIIKPIWDSPLSLGGAGSFRAMATDASDNIYIGGFYAGSGVIKSACITKYSHSGALQWLRIETSGTMIASNGITVVPDIQEVVTAGDGVTLWNDTGGVVWNIPLPATALAGYKDTILAFVGGQDSYVAMLDRNGVQARSISIAPYSNGRMAVRTDGVSLWVSSGTPGGIFSGTAYFVAKFNLATGKILWRHDYNDGFESNLDVDVDGNSYLAATQYTLNPFSLQYRIFKFASDGAMLWERQWVPHQDTLANYENYEQGIAVSDGNDSTRHVVVFGTTGRSDSSHTGDKQFYARAFLATTGDTLWTLRGDYSPPAMISQFRCGRFDRSGTLILVGDEVSTSVVVLNHITKFKSTTTEVKELPYGIPRTFVLHQNYPNPFNPSTTISFSLPSRSFVSLKVFDVLGREVSSLVAEELLAGTYTRQWNAASVPSGVYYYRLKVGSFAETKKLLLLK